MRYFKCDTVGPEDRKIITQDVPLTEAEKKSNRQGKLLNGIAIALFLVLFLSAFIGLMFLIAFSLPPTQAPIFIILETLVFIVAGVVTFVGSILLASCVCSPISRLAQKKLVLQKLLCYDRALIAWRAYYGWEEPCIVTKCYDSSDRKFKNRDICIFLFRDELRISADLKHGFSVRERDLGCYSFQIGEISLSQTQENGLLITRLESDGTFFYMGRRAKRFIEKKFIELQSESGG